MCKQEAGDLFLNREDELHDAAGLSMLGVHSLTGIQQRSSMLHALSSTPRTSLPAQSSMPCSHAGTCWKLRARPPALTFELQGSINTINSSSYWARAH